MALGNFGVGQLTPTLQLFIYQIKKTGLRNFYWLTQYHITSDKFRISSQAGLLGQVSLYCMALTTEINPHCNSSSITKSLFK